MPRLFEPCIWQLETTPDGFAEATLEVDGRILLSTVICLDGIDGNIAAAIDRFQEALRRLC